MVNLHEFLDEKYIKLSLKASRKKDAVEELLTLLKEGGKIQDVKNLLKDLLAREKMASTGIGEGIAIPHKLIPGLSETIIAFGRKRYGLNYDSIDNKPVTLFFLFLGPEGHNNDHLRLLSKLARFLHDPKFRDELNSVSKPKDIINAFRKQEKE